MNTETIKKFLNKKNTIGFVGATIACGSMLMKMVKGKTTEKARCISRDELLKELDGLPDEHLHCAKLAVDTLYSTLKQLDKKRKMSEI